VVVARKVIILNRGRKRQLKAIRWKFVEVFSLALFTLLAIAAGAFAVLWEMHHTHPYSEPPNVPQIKDAEPREP
jgi:hypothetical protein